MQSAYRILVASSPRSLSAGTGDLWDSGKIQSDRSTQIDYQGAPLKSFQRCYWKVRVWDHAGRASAWSEPAQWEMGILDDAGWQAQWITAQHLLAPEEGRRAPLFRKAFHLRERPRSARAYICGLGYHELYLNGSKVGDHVSIRLKTNYEHYAFYVTHDITESVSAGQNAAGVSLGTGWFHQDLVWQRGTYSVPGGTDYVPPRALLLFDSSRRWNV